MPSLAHRRRLLLDGQVVPVPLQISALTGWWDAGLSTLYQNSARTTPVTADGDPVGSWSDLSGLGNHVAQVTTTKRPLWKTAIQNGLAVLRFDGVDDFLTLSKTLAQPTTVFAVAKATSTATQQCILGDSAAVVVQTTSFGAYGGTMLSGASADTSWHTHSAQLNGTSSLIRTDRVETDGAAGTTTANSIAVGTFNQLTQFLGGDIAAILIYGALLSAAQILQVETYLKARWGTP